MATVRDVNDQCLFSPVCICKDLHVRSIQRTEASVFCGDRSRLDMTEKGSQMVGIDNTQIFH